MKEKSEFIKKLEVEEARLNFQKKFIKDALFSARTAFRNFREGYKVFSLKDEYSDYRISDKALSDIANNISDKYGCELIDLHKNNLGESKIEYIFEFMK